MSARNVGTALSHPSTKILCFGDRDGGGACQPETWAQLCLILRLSACLFGIEMVEERVSQKRGHSFVSSFD